MFCTKIWCWPYQTLHNNINFEVSNFDLTPTLELWSSMKYAGVNIEDLLHNYKQFVRVMLEYCSVVWHSSLTEQQSRSLERCQSVCLRVILGDNFISYEAALEITGLQKLSERRQSRCLDYGLKSVKHPENKRFFPENPNLNLTLSARQREPYIVNFARTKIYQQSAIPYIQKLLNKNAMDKRQNEEDWVEERNHFILV